MRNKVVSEGELVASAGEALRAATNAFAAVTSASTAAEFTLPLLVEAEECLRTAHAAVLALRGRAAGVKPPKVGD